MSVMNLKKEIVDLYKKTATELPEDIIFSLEKAKKKKMTCLAERSYQKFLKILIRRKKNSNQSVRIPAPRFFT